MDTGFVKTDINANGLAVVTFGHPAHNALPSDLLAKLCEHILAADAEPTVRLILLQSDGERTFCAGANFDELLTIADEKAGKAFFSGFADVINAIRRSSKFVIARVQGKAVGGGVGLIAACDYCFATENAAVKLSEVSINIGPFVIAPALERKIGVSALTALSLNPTVFFNAHWAHQHNLIHALEPNTVAMDHAIRQFCGTLLDKNREALTQLRQTLWRGTEHWAQLLYEQAAISGRLVLSKQTKQLLNGLKKNDPS